MTTLLLSHHMASAHGAGIERLARESGRSVEVIALPEKREARLLDDVCATLDAAFFSIDIFPHGSRQFFSAVRKAPKLKWLHVFNAGIDHPIYTEMLSRGVRLTTSAGTAAVPIAQTAITALLMLARNVPRWLAAQREHRWEPMRPPDVPRDIPGQTMVLLGVGHIGREIARLARALGLKVIGVRRSPGQSDDPVDEMHAPERLPEVLPRADWLIIAAPLTAETHGLIDTKLLARLPTHARVINVARGEIIDEPALVDALRTGRLAGAYLDVFQEEPLSASSPLWDLPNVLVTPHNAGAALGNDERIYEMFHENFFRWQRGETLLNEVTTTK